MGSGRKAGLLALALYGAAAILLPITGGTSPLDCQAQKNQALKHFRDELKISDDRAKAMETFRQNCSRSLTASFDKFNEKNSYCKAGWWKIFWALEDYGNSLDYGCAKTTAAMAKCDRKTLGDEELSDCVKDVAEKASEADRSAKALLENRIEEAQEVIKLATEHEKELTDPAPDSAAPATAGQGLRRYNNATEIAREQRELRTTATRFVQLAREESGKRTLSDQAFAATAERIRSNTAKESSITGSPEKTSSGSKWGTLNDSLKLGTGAMMLTTGGIALSRALGANPGAAPTAAPSVLPPSRAAALPSGGAGASSSLDRSTALGGETPSRHGDAKGASAPAEAQRVDGGTSGLSNAHAEAAGFPGAGSLTGSASNNEAGNGSRTGGSPRAASSSGDDTKLGDRSLASVDDDSAPTGTKAESASKGIGTGAGGGGLGFSHPFMKDGSEPSARELAGLPKLDFKNDPLSDQEKDLLKLLDGFDDPKANASPAQAREFLARQLGGYDPNGDFSGEAAAKAGVLASNGGVAGSESMSLFARVRFAHKRATKRGLIIGLHEEP
jgi:hypothetical protein